MKLVPFKSNVFNLLMALGMGRSGSAGAQLRVPVAQEGHPCVRPLPCPVPGCCLAGGQGRSSTCSTVQTTNRLSFSMATPNSLFVPEATLAANVDSVP